MRNPNCNLCPRHSSAKTVCLSGRGTSNPLAMFIGTGPSQQDDLQGKTWTGSAGQLLSQALRDYNIKPAYATNILRCPILPGTKITQKEIDNCLPYLDMEIAVVSPRILVAVGQVALKALGIPGKVKPQSGRVVGEYKGKPVFALLHPEHVLEHPSDLPAFEQAFRDLEYLLFPEKRPSVPETREVSPDNLRTEVLGWLTTEAKAVAFDYETDGRMPWDGGIIRTVAFSDGFRTCWMNVEGGGEPAKEAMRWFLTSDVKKIAHNMGFEYLWSTQFFGVEPKEFLFDTMILHHLFDENDEKGLKYLATKKLHAPTWDISPEMDANGWDFATVPVAALSKYNSLDAYWTAKLFQHLRDKLTPQQKRHYMDICIPLSKTCARMEIRGVKIDSEWCRQVEAVYATRQIKLEEEIQQDDTVRKMLREEGSTKFNINSAAQISTLVYTYLKLPVYETTPGGKPTARAPILERMRDLHPLVSKYLDWKQLQTARNNYLQKFPTIADKDEIVHARFSPAVVVTGRLSVTEPPMQTIPNKGAAMVKGMVVSRFPGGKIVNIDYSQLEIRLVASEADDENMLHAIRGGLDVHDETAKQIFGEGFTPEQRKKCKSINFGIVYGATENKIAKEFQMTKEEAKDILDRFRKAKPGIFRWMDSQHGFARLHKKVISRFGRVRHLPDVGSDDKYIQWRALRQSGNFPIQSQGADITNLAVAMLDQVLIDRKAWSMVVNQIHDSILIDMYPGEEWVIEAAKEVMEKKVPAKMPWLKVPLTVDVEVATRWGGVESIPEA